MGNVLLWAAPITGVIALLFALYKAKWVDKQAVGNDRMKEIAGHIADGAMAFLSREYKVLAVFVVIVAIALGASNYGRDDSHALIALSFVVGAFLSALAGYFGMKVATKANVRTANAARDSLNKGLMVAFSGGSVMGMSVAGLGLWVWVCCWCCTPTCLESTALRIWTKSSAFWPVFLWAPALSPCSPVSVVVSTPKPLMSVPTWSVKSKPVFRR